MKKGRKRKEAPIIRAHLDLKNSKEERRQSSAEETTLDPTLSGSHTTLDSRLSGSRPGSVDSWYSEEPPVEPSCMMGSSGVLTWPSGYFTERRD